MVEAWTSGVGAQMAGPGAVTILHGTTFVLSGANGDMDPARPHGFFFRDTRFISGWRLRLNGKELESLSGSATEPYRAMFVGRPAVDAAGPESHVLIERHRSLDGGFSERIVVHNHSSHEFSAALELDVEADFADLFDVKGGMRRPRAAAVRQGDSEGFSYSCELAGRVLEVKVRACTARSSGSGLRFELLVPPQGQWSTEIFVEPGIDGQRPEQDASVVAPQRRTVSPTVRQEQWNKKVPTLEVDNRLLAEVLATSRRDLGSLRIFDPGEDSTVIAAGAPWFMALFGRDSLLTSFMALAVDSSLALGTIQALAARQGTESNPATEEEPGKILHEVRLGSSPARELGSSGAYFGSVDATPLFVSIAGELTRWGLGGAVLADLMPAIDKALGWIEDNTAKDPDGFLSYSRSLPTGLANQGWKDSWDGITFADGTIAQGPLALCEVQGYVYTAYLARALMAQEAGDEDTKRHYAQRARHLKEAFNRRFWLPERGYFALGVDGAGRTVDSCTSNMGHCLWSGIIDEDKAPAVAARLMEPDMFSGWGVRTLSSAMGAYNPASYHNGSVWPHDNAIIAGGLMRYGFVDEAQRIAIALMQAAELFDDRLPELFCGLDRAQHPVPVPYPTSCSPQAWAAAAPMHLVRTMLRFDPCLGSGKIFIDPVLPADWGHLELGNIALGGRRISLSAAGQMGEVRGAPPGIEVIHGPRGPLADLLDVQEVH
ncbi:glycogen debranching N-terminal domain-containing protein [Paeniglutamicibacter gangotriensis]|uniref:amylo-alpha-1,6-glucosidase n=1 Tax=Paeniglutamicibacter gangotriensis TaxID=254787 RepID=UPI0037C6E9B1